MTLYLSLHHITKQAGGKCGHSLLRSIKRKSKKKKKDSLKDEQHCDVNQFHFSYFSSAAVFTRVIIRHPALLQPKFQSGFNSG